MTPNDFFRDRLELSATMTKTLCIYSKIIFSLRIFLSLGKNNSRFQKCSKLFSSMCGLLLSVEPNKTATDVQYQLTVIYSEKTTTL